MHSILASSLLVLTLSCCASKARTEPQKAPEGPARASTTNGNEVPEATEPKTLVFKTTIAAPLEKVWNTMLDPDGYRQWTAPFMAGSYFEGNWEEGERMHFLAPGGSGMVAEIAIHRLHETISIRHVGFVFGGVEDTTSDAVTSWAPAYENYHFASVPDGTEVTIEHEVLPSYEAQLSATWPKALAALRSICEG